VKARIQNKKPNEQNVILS